MKFFIVNIIPLLLLGFSSSLCSQSLDNILRQKSMDEIKARIQELEQTNRQSAAVVFLKAAIEPDGKTALSLYEQVLQLYPKSSYADDARFKIGQYYFMLGVYSLAEEQFRDLLRQYPNSPLRDGAAYFISQCYLAQDRRAEAKKALIQFGEQYRNSNLRILVANDLRQLEALELAPSGTIPDSPTRYSVSDEKPAPDEPPASAVAEGTTYSVQVGAFLKAENAERQQAYFKEHGYQAEVLTKQMDGKYLYVVCLNRFSNFDAAVDFGKKLNQKYRVSFQVIQLDDLP